MVQLSYSLNWKHCIPRIESNVAVLLFRDAVAMNHVYCATIIS
jgi:hypothetical protein